MERPLIGKVALVAGATRGAVRGVAVQVDHLMPNEVRAFEMASMRSPEAEGAASPRRSSMIEPVLKYPPIPPDDLNRTLTLARPDDDAKLPHIGMVGDTYTITVSGEDTNGRFCVIDMHVPPGGGPGPHRHDFEETFILLEGEIEVTFRGSKSIVRAGDTVNIPSNAPHQFHNASSRPARMICICAPAGNERFFTEVGVLVATRTTPPPKLNEKQMDEFLEKAKALAPKYHTELLKEA